MSEKGTRAPAGAPRSPSAPRRKKRNSRSRASVRRDKKPEPRLYQEIVAGMSVGMAVWHLAKPGDPASLTLIAANKAASGFAGRDLERLIGRTMPECFPGAMKTDRPGIYAEVARSGRTRKLGQMEVTNAKGNPTGTWGLLTAFPLPNRCVGTSFEDVTALNRLRDEAKRHEIFLNSIVENIPDMIFVKDAKELRFVRFNQAGEKLLGYAREDLIGRNDYDFFPKKEADFFTKKDHEVLTRGDLVDIPEEPIHTRHQGIRMLHTKKIPIRDDTGRPLYLLGISADITERKRIEAELIASQDALRIQATRDALTGLWNRVAVLDLLERELNLAKRKGARVSVILADLDHFKRINDIHGHAAGDAVLVEAARRMLSALRNYDVVGRYGGEEFLVVLSGVAESTAASNAERLRAELEAHPMDIGARTVSVTGSFGVATAESTVDLDRGRLIMAADQALYRAKKGGRNRVEVAAPERMRQPEA